MSPILYEEHLNSIFTDILESFINLPYYSPDKFDFITKSKEMSLCIGVPLGAEKSSLVFSSKYILLSQDIH